MAEIHDTIVSGWYGVTEPDAWRFELPGSIHNPHFAEEFEFSKELTRENVEPLYAPETIRGRIKEELWLLAEELDLDTSDVDRIEERLKNKFSGDKAGQTEERDKE